VLDLYFLEGRAKLLDLAALLDRLSRAPGDDDFRVRSMQAALRVLTDGEPDKAKRVLMTFSDPTTEPIAAAPGKGACGAWTGFA
jgi:hypothetical protein